MWLKGIDGPVFPAVSAERPGSLASAARIVNDPGLNLKSTAAR
jgi:hypothetical protein